MHFNLWNVHEFEIPTQGDVAITFYFLLQASRRAMIVAAMSNNFNQLDKQQLERQRKIKEMELERRRLFQTRE